VHLDCIFPVSPDCPLIRLYGFSSEEVARLQSAIAELASEHVDCISVHELPGILSINGCEQELCIRSRDQGIVQTSSTRFICGFTAGTWDNVEGLIEPFVAESNGYQWLAGGLGEPAILLSVSGQW
jgi:hypothetical protein